MPISPLPPGLTARLNININTPHPPPPPYEPATSPPPPFPLPSPESIPLPPSPSSPSPPSPSFPAATSTTTEQKNNPPEYSPSVYSQHQQYQPSEELGFPSSEPRARGVLVNGGFPPATTTVKKNGGEHGGYFKESRTDLSMREVAPVDVHVDVEAGGAVSITRAVGGGRVTTGRRRWGRRRGLLVVVMGLAVAVVVAVGVGVGVGLKGKGKGKGS